MITVFGASGRIGGLLVRQALDSGHEVRAVVRGTLTEAARPGLTVIRANVLDPTEITEAVTGADAVFSTLGPPNTRPTTILTDGLRSITTAMTKAGTTRLLAVSADGAYPNPTDGPVLRAVGRPLLQRVLRHTFADVRTMEDLIRTTPLDWTILRAPRLTDTPSQGAYRTSTGTPLPRARKIPRTDVAACLLALAPDPSSHRTTITVAT
ncbi:NAD(P)-binding oxidoreductase [Actinocorallia longicatena]|uniref:SDR family oxidoreductase n=1 Tax=Actinocorallia longicatena TaxID=111803 RepID=A0ABP6QRF1_9ACTN